jgi:aldose 1-epimerase
MHAQILTLEDGVTRLTLAPRTGGSIINWIALASGQPLLRPSDDEALSAGTPRRLSCYPLVPWSNRIGGGGFDTPNGWFALQANSANDALPIHGSAWQQPWEVIEHSAQHACLQLESAIPFAYRAQLRFSLQDGSLSITLTVTHLAGHPAWHGLGLHPYLPRTANTRLQAKAAQVWLSDDAGLPTRLEALPAQWDFNQLNQLPQSLISQPDLGYELECQASGSRFFLVFCPEGLDFFCFEPVSHPVNAHHLPGHPGLRLLQKGESTELSYRMRYKAI